MGDSDLTERLLLQLRDDVTQGFAAAARATDLARVEGQLLAYQAETDRRLEVLEVAENGRTGIRGGIKTTGLIAASLISNAALWAAVFFKHP